MMNKIFTVILCLVMVHQNVMCSEQPTEIKERDEMDQSWEYGYIPYNAIDHSYELKEFNLFPFRVKDSLQGDKLYPDEKNGFDHLKMTYKGGNAGSSNYCPVRRWTSPIDGSVNINGLFKHISPNGDGVRVCLYGPQGVIRQWIVHNELMRTDIKEFRVCPGDQIYFIVDCHKDDQYDDYEWKPNVTLVKDDLKKWAISPFWSAERSFARAMPND